MAIYGSLGDLPLPDILNMLARRSGLLQLTEGSGRQRGTSYHLYLNQGRLHGLFIDGGELTDAMLVTDVFRTLLDLEDGSFKFTILQEAALRGQLALPIKQLILSSATIIDELNAYRARFPHPTIVFEAAAPVLEHLPGDLDLFWARAEPHLLQGTSAERLARELTLSVEQVQLHFYKLRTAGAIAPRRSYTHSHSLRQTPADADGRTRPHLLRRLLRSLSAFGRTLR